MPLAEATDCHESMPARPAIACSVSPWRTLVSGFCPGRLATPLSGSFCARIFCCDSVSPMLARSGLPSGEKNSSDCSMPSTTPSKMNEPHWKRTGGGTSLSLSSADLGVVFFCGVMKKMTGCVRRRTSSTGLVSIAVTSNHSCSASLVVPSPTNCRPGVPAAWSPPLGWTIWLA